MRLAGGIGVVAALATTPGCFMGSRHTRLAVNGTIVAVGGAIALVGIDPPCQSSSDIGCGDLVSPFFYGFGGGLAAIGLAALVYTLVAVPEPLAGPDPRAVEILDQARIAARQGDCARVSVLARQVADIDVGFYARPFGADPDIAACLRPH